LPGKRKCNSQPRRALAARPSVSTRSHRFSKSKPTNISRMMVSLRCISDARIEVRKTAADRHSK
jgi:hypothetical protein